jgi:hypothetical protein
MKIASIRAANHNFAIVLHCPKPLAPRITENLLDLFETTSVWADGCAWCFFRLGVGVPGIPSPSSSLAAAVTFVGFSDRADVLNDTEMGRSSTKSELRAASELLVVIAKCNAEVSVDTKEKIFPDIPGKIGPFSSEWQSPTVATDTKEKIVATVY